MSSIPKRSGPTSNRYILTCACPTKLTNFPPPPSSPLSPFSYNPHINQQHPIVLLCPAAAPPCQIYHGGPTQLLLSDINQNATAHLPLPHCYPAAALLLPIATPPLPAATLLPLPFGTCAHQLNAWLCPTPFCCCYHQFSPLDTSTAAAPSYCTLCSPAFPDGASAPQLSSTNGLWVPVHLRQLQANLMVSFPTLHLYKGFMPHTLQILFQREIPTSMQSKS